MSTKPEAHHFLSALFDNSDLIELRVIDPGTGEVKERRFEKGPEAAAGMINWLRDHPWYKGCNIYYACAARRTRRGGSKTNLSRVRALWADCDGTAPDDVLLHLLLFEGPEIHQPSIVVASGGGAHLYWLLDEPLDVSVPGNIERLEAILKGLARAIPADPAATDASRVLRPPDTMNYPSAKKRAAGRVEAPVRLVELRPDRRFSLDDFAAFEAIGRERAPGAKVDVAGATWPMWDGAGEDELPDSVRAALRQHDIFSRYFRREAIESEDQSTIDYALACAGARCGLDAEAIYQLVKASRTIFVGDEKAAHRDDYFRRTALKAHTEHANKHAESMARFAAEPQPLVPPKSPRRINLSNRQRDDLASDVAAAVVHWNDPPMLFRRGGAVVRAYAGARGEIELREQDAGRFLDVTAPVAIYTENRNTSDGWKVVNAKLSTQEAGVVLERLTVGDGLPPLRGIVHHPVLRSDGSIVSRPGYDAASGLYLDPLGPPLVLSVAERPTPSDASVATEALLEVVAEFPFVSPAHKANALAALITPPLRELIEGPVPLFANDAPAAGSGKSLLVRVASVLSRGRVAPALPEPGREDEWRKRILALLIAGADIVFIDNVEKPLQSASLAGVLTSTDWSDRVLGVSTMATSLPHRATWYATGNNLDIRGDLVRRTVWIRIDPQLARPDERDNASVATGSAPSSALPRCGVGRERGGQRRRGQVPRAPRMIFSAAEQLQAPAR